MINYIYIYELIKWGKAQLGKANLSDLPNYNHLAENVKLHIINIHNESGKKKKHDIINYFVRKNLKNR